MSQEPKSQLSFPELGESETTAEQGLRLQRTSNRVQSVLKAQSMDEAQQRRYRETGSRTSGRWRLASRVFGQAPAGVECC